VHTVSRRPAANTERTPEERAAAAAERAARRGQAAPPPETFTARRLTPRAAIQEWDPVEEWEAVPEPEPEPLAPSNPRAARPQLPRRRTPPPLAPRRVRRFGRRALALLALALIVGALLLINAIFQPFHGDPTGAVSVRIPAGADAGEIGERLEQAGVIENARLFEANATLTLRRAKLRPGDYRLARNMSNGAAIEALMQGPEVKVVPTFSITIPEGRSRRENAPLIKKSEVRGDYAQAATDPRFVRRARDLGLPSGARSLEGFLFPATYTLIDDATARDLVKRQLDAFQQNFAKVDMRTAKRRNLTRYDVVIIASMVEREAQLARERPLIAAVIHNRLKEGIPLGIDATIRYQINNWARPLRVSELERDTPYNTRTRRGLPPTPIGNPGLASLKAAANPANRDYRFFVRKPGKSGEHAFSSTDRQFQRDVARYQASRGGP
jgi:UPF0755 protein